MTMDILWAISHPHTANVGSSAINPLFPGAVAADGHFAVPMPAYADGSWDMYEDFVGGVQFWGYGLVSGSGDGAVRMWDSESLSILPR
jgi:mitochondrial division protein 1